MPNDLPKFLPNVDYAVKTAYSTETLCKLVNTLLRKGWQLYGNITTTPYNDKGKAVIVFTQALTKEIA